MIAYKEQATYRVNKLDLYNGMWLHSEVHKTNFPEGKSYYIKLFKNAMKKLMYRKKESKGNEDLTITCFKIVSQTDGEWNDNGFSVYIMVKQNKMLWQHMQGSFCQLHSDILGGVLLFWSTKPVQNN